MAQIDKSLEFAEISSRQQDSLARGDAFARFSHERRNVSVIASRGLRLHRARLDSFPCYREVIKLQARVAGELPVPIGGEIMRCDRILREITGVLESFLGVGEELLRCFVDRFGLVENHDRFLE